MNDEVLQALLESKRAAAAGALERERLAESLRSYILAKYRINDGDCASSSL